MRGDDRQQASPRLEPGSKVVAKRTAKRSKRAALALTALLFLAAALLAAAPPPEIHVIRAGHLLDVTTMTVTDDVTLVVQDGVMRARYTGPPQEALPAGAHAIDLSAFTVLVGLIDAHVHLTIGGVPRDNARKTVEAGFTTVADLGSVGGAGVRLRDRIAADSIAGPTVLAAGSWIGGRGGVCEFGRATVRGADEAAVRARDDLSAGATLLKACVTDWAATALTHPDSIELTAEELDAIRREAERGSARLVAHAIGQRGVLLAVQHGVRLLAHAPLVDSTAAAQLARDRVCVATTLSTVPDGAPRTAATEALLRLRRSGVRIVLGTDAGVLAHGTNAAEIGALHAIGFTPAEVLRAATTTAAECLGLAADYGSLRNGTEASFIAVAGNPLEDPRVLQRPVFVMARGRVLSHQRARQPSAD